MLVELAVENFALVEKVRLPFGAGLNLLTGETGAGKSILLDALGMVLGERATGDLVRHGCDKARVEAVFQMDETPEPRLLQALESTGIELEDGLLILSRELTAAGKSQARVNGRPITVGTLKTLGDALVDIHGQHEHQSLMAVERHTDLLDLWAGADVQKKKATVLEAYEAARAARREWEALLRDARERARTLDLLSYQRDEIEAAAPKVGEDEDLAAEKLKLGSAERLHAAAQSAYSALRDSGAIEALSSAVGEIERASRLDPSLSSLLETLQSALYAADDAARDVRTYRDSVEFQPERLEEIEARLDILKTLKRKYGEGLAEVLAYHTEISERLETLENAEERLGQLERATKDAEAELARRCATLTEARKKAAAPFAKAIQTELKDLAMAATRFSVSIEPKEPGASGADAVEFLISPNPGEPLRPLAKIASGGELSRLMLALKSVMARNIAPPVMVFDEIDSGIGGRTGTILAEKLHTLAGRAQTLCITHLPQIAAKGDVHFFIEKRVEGKRTVIHVAPLGGEARVSEIARMLGGEATEAVVKHARELLGSPA